MNKIEEIREKRRLFLSKLYELSEGSTRKCAPTDAIDKELGFDKELSKDIVAYLIGKGLIREATSKPYTITILSEGIDKVEADYIREEQPKKVAAIPLPASGASHFAP